MIYVRWKTVKQLLDSLRKEKFWSFFKAFFSVPLEKEKTL